MTDIAEATRRSTTMQNRVQLPGPLRPVLALGLFATVTIAPASAQSPFESPQPTGEERIPITDPGLLERYGFEPDATNIYATPEAYAQMMMGPAQRAAAQAATVEARREEIRATKDNHEPLTPFGTTAAGYSSVIAKFLPVSHHQEYLGGLGFSCEAGSPLNFPLYVELDSLPHGAKLEHVDLRYRDDNGVDGFEVAVGRLCFPDFADGDPTVLMMGTYGTTGAEDFIRFASIGPLDEDIDLQSCSYVVVVSWGAPCPGSVGIVQVRAQWRRQVSPAPATAAFGDVPTGHLFFQQVEALAASGITSGGGGGDFCPNTPLTRGQMAAFLAKALGLHWGEISQ